MKNIFHRKWIKYKARYGCLKFNFYQKHFLWSNRLKVFLFSRSNRRSQFKPSCCCGKFWIQGWFRMSGTTERVVQTVPLNRFSNIIHVIHWKCSVDFFSNGVILKQDPIKGASPWHFFWAAFSKVFSKQLLVAVISWKF